MLNDILKHIQNNSSISLNTLSQELEIPIPALEGMLETLVRKGKLEPLAFEMPERCPGCEECPLDNPCALSDLYLETRFRVVE